MKSGSVRLHGHAPYEIFLIHGGPGAAGSLKTFAEELSGLLNRGVAEPFQTEYSVNELIEELRLQIEFFAPDGAALAGHSWGALLAAMFAAKYPRLCSGLIMIGCPPLEDKYVEEILKNRLRNLPPEDGLILKRFAGNAAAAEDMKKLPGILIRSDNSSPIGAICETLLEPDEEACRKIWPQVARLRTGGALLSAFEEIKCAIYPIHGAEDPHPVKGVAEPLEKLGVRCETHILKRCGHNPFMEKYAREEFFGILKSILEK